MGSTSIAAFAQAAQQAQEWVNELADDLEWTDRRAYRLLRNVLHALRDWLPQEEMADLAAQLPVLVRGIYFEGWKPSETPVWNRKKEDFIARINSDLIGKYVNIASRTAGFIGKHFGGRLSGGPLNNAPGLKAETGFTSAVKNGSGMSPWPFWSM